jgi:hypothetical protein
VGVQVGVDEVAQTTGAGGRGVPPGGRGLELPGGLGGEGAQGGCLGQRAGRLAGGERGAGAGNGAGQLLQRRGCLCFGPDGLAAPGGLAVRSRLAGGQGRLGSSPVIGCPQVRPDFGQTSAQGGGRR